MHGRAKCLPDHPVVWSRHHTWNAQVPCLNLQAREKERERERAPSLITSIAFWIVEEHHMHVYLKQDSCEVVRCAETMTYIEIWHSITILKTLDYASEWVGYKNPVVPQFHKQRRHAEATLAFQHLMDSRWGTLFVDVLAVNLLVVPNSVCFFYPTMWKPLWPSRKYHDTCLILILLIHLDTCDTLIQYTHCCITLFLSLSPIWLVFSRMQIAEPQYNVFKWIKVVWMLQWWPSWGNVLEFACCSQHLCVN